MARFKSPLLLLDLDRLLDEDASVVEAPAVAAQPPPLLRQQR